MAKILNGTSEMSQKVKVLKELVFVWKFLGYTSLHLLLRLDSLGLGLHSVRLEQERSKVLKKRAVSNG